MKYCSFDCFIWFTRLYFEQLRTKFLSPSASIEWEYEWEYEIMKYLLIANRQWSKMKIIRNECCLQWDLECLIKSNQIKSNQIKSYFPISHIPYDGEYYADFPELEWVREDLNNHQNTIHISFHFNSIYILFMINVLS